MWWRLCGALSCCAFRAPSAVRGPTRAAWARRWWMCSPRRFSRQSASRLLLRCADRGRPQHGTVQLAPTFFGIAARKGACKQNCWFLGPALPARPCAGSGGWLAHVGAGHALPSAVLATACCTATPNCDHGGKRRGAPAFQRLPTSAPRTTSCCGPPALSSGCAARLPTPKPPD